MEEHVGDREHVGKLLLLHRPKRGLHPRLVLGALHVRCPHVPDGAGQEAPGAAGRVEQQLAGLGVDHLGHEGGDGAGRVELARIAGRLKVVQDLLVDVAEVLAVREVVEVDVVDAVHYLPHQLPGLHVIVGVLEHLAHGARPRSRDRQLLQGRKEIAVDEREERVPRDPFGISGPGPPLEVGGDGRAVAVLQELELLVLVVDDLEKEHPAELTDALGITIDTGILAHDILNGFDERADRHVSGCFLVEL